MSQRLCGRQDRTPDQALCIPQLIANQAFRLPDAPALLSPGRSPLTYRRLYQQIQTTAETLKAMGCGSGARIALMLPNGPELAVAFLVVSSYATCAPLNTAYSARELDSYLADLNVDAIIIQAGMRSPARTIAQAHGVEVIELVPEVEAEAGLFVLQGAWSRAGESLSDPFAGVDDVALLLQTSGTTTRPKVVPLSHRNICVAARYLQVALGVTEQDRCLNMLPLFHVFGLISTLIVSVSAGASMVCSPNFDALQFFSWLEDFRPTWYPAVPTMHQAILEVADQHRTTIARCPLKFIRSSSAPLPVSLRTELEERFNTCVVEGYGMTESTSALTCHPPPRGVRKPGSIGRAIGTDIAIMDERGMLLAPDAVGEIVIRGHGVFSGYENEPLINQQVFSHGWFKTGDQGYLDAEGYLFITGRIKELISRGGEKIAPREIDDVIRRHPAVEEAVAFAVPHHQLGEDVAVAVRLQSGATVTAQELREFAAVYLANFKVPRQVHFVEAIPKNSMGKPQRIQLAETLGLVRLESAIPRAAHVIEPGTPLEQALSEVWCQVLGLDQVGIRDSFFELGGDSLMAEQLAVRLRDVMRVSVTIRDVFEASTIATMAEHIEMLHWAVEKPDDKAVDGEYEEGAL